MKEEYKSNWRSAWGSKDRDYLFGQPIPKTPETEEFIQEVIIPQVQPPVDVDTETLFGISSPKSKNWWGIDFAMITDKPLPTWNWRFKTAEEFKEEYGDDWETELGNKSGGSGVGWVNPNMNYLLGQKLEQNLYTENLILALKDDFLVSDYVEIRRLGIDTKNVNESWTVSWEMFTDKPLSTTAATKPTTEFYISNYDNWRFKTAEEFEKEFGSNWRQNDSYFSVDMDYLLGEKIDTIREDARKFLEDNKRDYIDTYEVFGINNRYDRQWYIEPNMLTQDPLPTAVTPKKRGRKPKASSNWTWRFKTREEMESEFGAEWPTEWGGIERDYLLGKPIPETTDTVIFINNNVIQYQRGEFVDTNELFGIDSGDKDVNDSQYIDDVMITDKPLPNTPKKRGRKPKSELPEIDLGGLEDIGDIDIDDIDFDNLVI